MLTVLRKRFRETLLERWHAPFTPIEHLPPCVFRQFRDHRQIRLVDVGANRGQFALALAELRPLFKPVLIEPIPALAQALREDARLTGAHVSDCVVSDEKGEVSFNYFPDAPDMSSALELDTSVEDMEGLAKGRAVLLRRPTDTLDNVVPDDGERIDLLKIDVQGLEHRVLAGAPRTLARTAYVYTEVSFRPLYEGSSVFSDIHGILDGQGFALIGLERGYTTGTGEILQADALFAKRSSKAT